VRFKRKIIFNSERRFHMACRNVDSLEGDDGGVGGFHPDFACEKRAWSSMDGFWVWNNAIDAAGTVLAPFFAEEIELISGWRETLRVNEYPICK
jgi:hypothetical protein